MWNRPRCYLAKHTHTGPRSAHAHGTGAAARFVVFAAAHTAAVAHAQPRQLNRPTQTGTRLPPSCPCSDTHVTKVADEGSLFAFESVEPMRQRNRNGLRNKLSDLQMVTLESQVICRR